MASRAVAVSRTERLTTLRTTNPAQASFSGALVCRARVGFRPTSPHALAGMRMDPPPSPAWAIGTSPAATAAADPPLDPPGERSRSHGLWVAPRVTGSVVGCRPSSGQLVRPTTTSPEAL